MHSNQQEFLKERNRKRSKVKYALDDLEVSDNEGYSSESVEGEKNNRTHTKNLYKELMKSPDFLLTMQPRFYEDEESNDETDGDIGGWESKFMATTFKEDEQDECDKTERSNFFSFIDSAR